MKKLCLFLALVLSVVLLAGCGTSPQEDAAEKYEEMVTVELGTVENGIAYYNAYISKDFGWDNAGPTRQCTIARMAADECEALCESGVGIPVGAQVHRADVMGFLEPTGYLAFSWSGGGTVIVYTNESRSNETYKFSDVLE